MKALKIIGLVLIGIVVLIGILIASNPEARNAVGSGAERARQERGY